MFYNNKKIALLAALMFLVLAGQVFGQTTVLGFELGKSTYGEVKGKLPKGVQITRDKGNAGMYGGPMIWTQGGGYSIDGLKVVEFCFDEKQKLVYIIMLLEERRFIEIKKIIASKYRMVRSKSPDVFLLFKANGDYVYLRLPRDKNIGFGVEYKTGAVYRQEQLAVRQGEEWKKKEDRRIQKALEEEALKERDKF